MKQCGTRLKQKTSHLVTHLSWNFRSLLRNWNQHNHSGDQVDLKSILLRVIFLSAQERFGVNDLCISEKDLVVLKDMEESLLEGDFDNDALDVLETTP